MLLQYLMLSVKEADEKIYSHTPLIEVCRLSQSGGLSSTFLWSDRASKDVVLKEARCYPVHTIDQLTTTCSCRPPPVKPRVIMTSSLTLCGLHKPSDCLHGEITEFCTDSVGRRGYSTFVSVYLFFFLPLRILDCSMFFLVFDARYLGLYNNSVCPSVCP